MQEGIYNFVVGKKVHWCVTKKNPSYSPKSKKGGDLTDNGVIAYAFEITRITKTDSTRWKGCGVIRSFIHCWFKVPIY